MELDRGCEANKGSKMKNNNLHDGTIALNHETVLVIRLPGAQVLRILSRSLFLAIVLAALPFLGTFLKEFSSSSHSFVPAASSCVSVEMLNSILHDLADQGLFKKDDKVLLVNPPNGFITGPNTPPFNNNEIDMVIDSDLRRKILFPDGYYDFVFMSSSIDAEFVDRILKINGIVVLPLGVKSSNSAFRKQSNYRVVYIRRYDSIIVALKKTGPAVRLVDNSSPRRKLCQLMMDTKKVALKGLEDVLLEPPTKDFVKSKYLKKIKYLPDLLGDSLQGYNRRLFIGVGLAEENKGVVQWFQKNYPKKNTKFEIHNLVVPPEDSVMPHTDVSAWLSKHVKEEEYVVMKAEAEVVEKMIKERTIYLVDELFLECKYEWWEMGKRKKNGRAYWECLALYGLVKDKGVAVHQWWG
ncbi:uncharacterized protein LOC113852430 [Abrus precatorius]|uniref:Uncharacterized protein LOC113852430 n=1 Tax=Abrus precatorius TaxID=3816 RepID=A0A8B8K4B3_ABRPR|nr:uncharacterized protein LOC113852430 [Abrus precatorius]